MQINKTYTIVAGTPFNLATQSATPPKTADQVFAWQISIQMAHGGTGLGYVMDGIAINRVPAATNSSDLSLELAPATATAPGGSMNKTMPQGQDRVGVKVHEMWIDGSVNGDKVIVSYDVK